MSRQFVPQHATDQQKRAVIQQQVNDLMRKATQRPGEQDSMGMVGFASTLLAAHLQTLLLQSDEPGAQEVEGEQG